MWCPVDKGTTSPRAVHRRVRPFDKERGQQLADAGAIPLRCASERDAEQGVHGVADKFRRRGRPRRQRRGARDG